MVEYAGCLLNEREFVSRVEEVVYYHTRGGMECS